jgi:hypothetical protein
LQDQRRRRLVHGVAALPRVLPAAAERAVRDYGREALVYQPHRYRRQACRQRRGEPPRRRGRYAFAPGQSGGQTDYHFDGSLVGSEFRQFVNIAPAALNSRERTGQQALGVAPCHTDTRRTEVDG